MYNKNTLEVLVHILYRMRWHAPVWWVVSLWTLIIVMVDSLVLTVCSVLLLTFCKAILWHYPSSKFLIDLYPALALVLYLTFYGHIILTAWNVMHYGYYALVGDKKKKNDELEDLDEHLI